MLLLGTWKTLQPGAKESLQGSRSEREVVLEALMSGYEVATPAKNHASPVREGVANALKNDIALRYLIDTWMIKQKQWTRNVTKMFSLKPGPKADIIKGVALTPCRIKMPWTKDKEETV